ncbi:MAG: DNRLRE domain-containing protein, partial [Candidatus Aenigmarchaeota archaeon]|nr:DNRLRE domain-containing protein [Candidatus Aenigmarchaeota archaeon]
QSTISYNLKEADEAYYIANAGIQQGVFTLKYNPGFRGTVADTPFSTGSYSFTIADIVSPMGDVLISSTGTSGTATRTVEKRLSTSGTFIVYPPLIKDTFVTDKNENKNFGISDHLKIGCKTEPERGLFEYDLSMIPAGATIKTAVFELYKFFGERKGGGSQISVNIHWMKRSWNEGIHDNANCTIGATWITSDCVTAWPIEGGDYDSTSQASTTIYYSEPPQWYQWNVKNLIKNWHNLSIT